MKYVIGQFTREHYAYFSDGVVIAARCSRKEWKQHVNLTLSSIPDYLPRKVWFRPCQEWRDAVKRSEAIIRERYSRDPFIRMISELWEDADDAE